MQLVGFTSHEMQLLNRLKGTPNVLALQNELGSRSIELVRHEKQRF